MQKMYMRECVCVCMFVCLAVSELAISATQVDLCQSFQFFSFS